MPGLFSYVIETEIVFGFAFRLPFKTSPEICFLNGALFQKRGILEMSQDVRKCLC